jgi:hypothetical protein
MAIKKWSEIRIPADLKKEIKSKAREREEMLYVFVKKMYQNFKEQEKEQEVAA